jgi:GT2 family glycosyltransferase
MTLATRIHIIMTCHNRRDHTLTSLSALRASLEHSSLEASIHLCDDGSTDGTAEAVASFWPTAHVLRGDGSYYWAKGMRVAEDHARASASPSDLILWLNDDTELARDSIARLVDCLDRHPRSIVVGTTVADTASSESTYGGMIRSGFHPLRYRLVGVTDVDTPVDAMNGNIVLQALETSTVLGGIDGHFSHAWADIEYAHRARASGREVIVAPGIHGCCSRNPPAPRLSFAKSWQRFRSVKGAGNSASLKRLLQAVRPRTWAFFFLWSYAGFVARWVVGAARPRKLSA